MRKTNKSVAAVLSVALVAAIGAGATVAWLTSTTQTVTNTFTAGDVEITLTETFNTDSDNDGTIDSWTAQMVPGAEYTKDPVVTVTRNTNVDCYLFVKFEESEKASTYLTYTSTLTTDAGWTQGTGTIPSNVWYRTVEVDDEVKSWHLLAGDKVVVNGDTVTKATMAEATAQTLAYTAYAVQKDNIGSAADAWEKVSTQA